MHGLFKLGKKTDKFTILLFISVRCKFYFAEVINNVNIIVSIVFYYYYTHACYSSQYKVLKLKNLKV